jgi:hypothetical protein
LDHGHVERTIDSDPMGARACLDEVSELGVDLDDVTDLLEREGVASFSKSFDELIDQLGQKATELNAR